MEGQHGCMRCRGVQTDATCVTSECRGFLRDKGVKAEFLKLL
jgi:GTP cyclohydrolase I